MADGNMYVLSPFFQTRSFDDMVKPLALYAQAYKEQEAKIEDMTDKAAALEWIANRDPQSQTAALYRDMSEKIKGIRDDMMINGLQGGTRSRILGARRMYSANSAEITRRYEDMKAYQNRMEQLWDKDNSIIFSPESQNVSIDDFAGGNRPKIKAVSGNEIMARGAAAGKRFTSLIFGDGVEGKAMGDQFWKVYKEQGMTDDALAAALDKIGQGDKYPMLSKVINGVYDSFAGFSPYDQQLLKNKFMEGFYSGAVYSRDVDYKNNEAFIDPYKAAQIRWGDAENRRAELKFNNEMAEYNILSGKPFTVGDNTYVYDRTTDRYTNVKTGQSTAAPTNVTGSTKGSNNKTTKTKLNKPNGKVLAVDSKGNRIKVTDNAPQGLIMTTADRDEITAAWKSIKKQHPGEYDFGVEYHIYKHEIKDDSGNKKIIYYAKPLVNNNTLSSNNSNQSTTTTSSTDEPII